MTSLGRDVARRNAEAISVARQQSPAWLAISWTADAVIRLPVVEKLRTFSELDAKTVEALTQGASSGG